MAVSKEYLGLWSEYLTCLGFFVSNVPDTIYMSGGHVDGTFGVSVCRCI